MCLAVPARVISIDGDVVEVEQSGKIKKVSAELVRPKVGDYVLIQFGFVTEVLNKDDAEKSLKAWREAGEKE